MYFVCIAMHICEADVCAQVWKLEATQAQACVIYFTSVKPGPLTGPDLAT